MKGIDVSTYQKSADFEKVKAAGYEFAIIRVGYRGYLYNRIVKDSMFDIHVNNAIKHNMPYGIYFLSQAINEAEAREEARFCINEIKKLSVPPSFPIYIDSEWSNTKKNGRADVISKTARTNCIIAFCEELEKNGYYAGIYASTSWFYNQLDNSRLDAYDKWVAQYNTKCQYSGSYGMWQYGGSINYLNSTKVNGVSGDACDQNICYKNYPQIIKSAGLNGYPKQENKQEEIKKVVMFKIETDWMSDGDYKTITSKLNELQIPFEHTTKEI